MVKSSRFMGYVASFLNLTKLSSLLFLCSCLPVTNNEPLSVEGSESKIVSIKTTNPSIGKPIEVSVNGYNESDVDYVWYVNGIKANGSSSSLTPTIEDVESFIEVKAYDKGDTLIGSDSIYFSKLPVAYINTDDGLPITERKVPLPASMFIQGNGKFASQYDGRIEISGRGTSSWHYEKKPYKIKLDTKSNLFGFGKSKHYVLLSNSVDPSLLRNATGYQIAEQAGLVSTGSTWVDVVLNGEFIGNYQLAEHVRIGSQLVDITNYEDMGDDVAKAIYKANQSLFPNGKSELEDALSADLSWLTTHTFTFNGVTYNIDEYYTLPASFKGGYLFELGNNYDSKESYFLSNGGIGVSVSKPEALNTNETLFSYVQERYQDLEDALKSEDGYNDKGEHYSQIADIDSMVSYWLVNEIMSNEDSVNRSRFMYLDDDGLFVYGPAWDFDISSAAVRAFLGPNSWNATRNLANLVSKQDIFGDMVNDPYFQALAREKYFYLRPYLERLIEDDGILEQERNYLYESAVANETLWTVANKMYRTFSGKRGDYKIFKDFFKARLNWLDKQFESRDSLRKSLHFFLYNDEYDVSSRVKIALDLPNGENAQYSAIDKSIIPASITTPNGYETSIYVDGVSYQSYLSNGKPVTFELSTDALNKDHASNVISVIATKGNSIIKNDAVVQTKAFETIAIDKDGSCSHSMYKLSSNKGYYCSLCDHYFKDKNGTNILDSSEVVLSSVKSRLFTGRVHITRSLIAAAIIVPTGIASLITLTIVKKIKKKRLLAQSK